jgi:SOS-response transcriptional repressor LexA
MRRYDDILEFIVSYIEEHGHSPSNREIAEGCYRSKSSVARAIEVLAARGKINYKPYIPRSISLPRREDHGKRNNRPA